MNERLPLPWWLSLVGLAVMTSLGGCQPAEVDFPDVPLPLGTATATMLSPTPLPAEPRTLIVCLRQEPESLYLYSPLRLYGAANREADSVLQALYDGPFEMRGYRLQPVILEKMPSLADGDARVEAVPVGAGEIYFDPVTLLPQALSVGATYLPSGCRDLTCGQRYAGGEVSMDRLVVDFRLRPDIRWSDGEPLTAADSVFSFSLHAHRETRDVSKFAIQHTASYQALDDLTVRWVGIPGFLDSEYQANFWTPLPQHVLAGLAPGDLPEDAAATRQPLGWGPYVLESWDPGRQITLRKNALYFRAAEGLPRFDFLVFRFVGSDPNAAIQQLLTGECDVLDESALEGADLAALTSLAKAGRLNVGWAAGPLLERVDFNLAPSGAGGLGLFQDPRTRRALGGCIDRQALVDEVLQGLGQLTETYLPVDHPLYAAGLRSPEYDLAASEALLEQIGWLDQDGDPATPRTAFGVAGVRGGTPLEFTLLTLDEPLQVATAERLRQDLARCGVLVHVEAMEPDRLLAPFPDGPVFGRTFQAVLWSWLVAASPPCEMFASDEIPAADRPNGSNATGFADAEYDAACRALRMVLPGAQEYTAAAHRTQEILVEQLPMLPLFARPRLAASRPEICGLDPDASAYSVLWNLETLGLEGECGTP